MFLEAYLITFCGRVANVSSQIYLLTGRVKDASCIIENGKTALIDFCAHVHMMSSSPQFQAKKWRARSLAEMENC